MQATSTYNRKMLAITHAIKKLRHYLFGHQFTIITNQKSLRELASQTVQTPEQQYWLSKLMGCEFNIQYRLRRDNAVAEALSRVEQLFIRLFSITTPHFQLIDELKATALSDMEFLAFHGQFQI